MLKNIAFFLIFLKKEEETLGINWNVEYNQQFHGFKTWMDPILKFVRSKKLSNWLSNSSTEILRKNKQLQY